jgi:hypothetical protein
MSAAANKSVVRRLITEVLNGGRLEIIDGLYAPGLAPGQDSELLGLGSRFEVIR